MKRRKRPRPCESLAFPHELNYARLYVTGWRCANHTPAAENGRPEAPPGPGWPIYRTPSPDPSAQPSE
ncbi:hypothetical protein BX257_4777 [Streptomyces sp. 3212.3]|uniref:hypothetical protein n=1 Tax=Streptomyces sp. 3212.3 TaxID=1938846 RepID=UPI000E25176C|nr:hypothetical protein [Streptomyces sp. 3212.3]REE62164.1 hypothetical protein BX257_4777 [Streptomyces sp. 3212.3]